MTAAPACYDECHATLRDHLTALGLDANISTLQPLFPRGYEALDLRCPHGVAWYAEPTAEQIAAWNEQEVS